MINEHPNMDYQDMPQGKIILPAYNEGMQPPFSDGKTAFTPAVQFNPYNPAEMPPPSPYARTKRSFWHDPASRVLAIAILVVLVASIASLAFFGHLLASQAGGTSGTSAHKESSPPKANANTHQTLATPQPTIQPSPTAAPAVVVPPTQVPQPTQPAQPMNGPLMVQITMIPQQVTNDTTVPVTIQTNRPGINVSLVVTYTVPPGNGPVEPQMADANGNATLQWPVHVMLANGILARAQVVAVVRDKNGNRVVSDPVTVLIVK